MSRKILFRDNFVRQRSARIVPINPDYCWVLIDGAASVVGDSIDLAWAATNASEGPSSNCYARSLGCIVESIDRRWLLCRRGDILPSTNGSIETDVFPDSAALASAGAATMKSGESFCRCRFEPGPAAITIKRTFTGTGSWFDHYHAYGSTKALGAASLFWAGGRRRGMRIESVLERRFWYNWYDSPNPTAAAPFELCFSGGEGDELPPEGTPVTAVPEIQAWAWPRQSPVGPIYRVEGGRWGLGGGAEVIRGPWYSYAPGPETEYPPPRIGPRALWGAGDAPAIRAITPLPLPARIIVVYRVRPYQTFRVGFGNFSCEVQYAGYGRDGDFRLRGPKWILASDSVLGPETPPDNPVADRHWPDAYPVEGHTLIIDIDSATVECTHLTSRATRQITASAAGLELDPASGVQLGGQPTAADPELRFSYIHVEKRDES